VSQTPKAIFICESISMNHLFNKPYVLFEHPLRKAFDFILYTIGCYIPYIPYTRPHILIVTEGSTPDGFRAGNLLLIEPPPSPSEAIKDQFKASFL
jgi:hypothetical protein